MDLEQLEQYIYTYGKDLYSFCCSVTQNRQEADDLYQDTFLKVYEIRDTLVIDRNPKGFLMSVSVNLYRNYKRKLTIRQRIIGAPLSVEDSVTDIPSGEVPIEERFFQQEEHRAVRCAVKKLPDKYKIPILLFYMEQLPLAQIAKILKLPEGTVKSRIHRAKIILKQMLEEVHDGA